MEKQKNMFFLSKRRVFLLFGIFAIFLLACLSSRANAKVFSDIDDYMWDAPSRSRNRTESVRQAYGRAKAAALQLKHGKVTPLHLAYAIFEDSNGLGCSLLTKCNKPCIELRRALILELIGLDIKEGAHAFNNRTAQLHKPMQPINIVGSSLLPTVPLRDIHKRALHYQKSPPPSTHLSMEHVIHALVENPAIADVFLCIKLPPKNVVEALEKTKDLQGFDEIEKETYLHKFGINLVEKARRKELLPIIGREEEINDLLSSLLLMKKHNPVITGEPGVGKTAIVEALAQRIVKGDVPVFLRKKKIMSMDMASVMAGASYRGELEERVKKIIDEAVNDNDTVLFFDEMHTLTTAGKGEGSVDVVEMLKPYLSSGKIRLIGATTTTEFTQHVEKNAALDRRLQRLKISEASEVTSISILRGLKNSYERHHGLRVTDSALVAAVTLSARYMHERFLPDKAIETLDKAFAMVRLQLDSCPDAIDKRKREIETKKQEVFMLENEKGRDAQERKKRLEQKINELTKELEQLTRQYEIEKKRMERLRSLHAELQDAHDCVEEARRCQDSAALAFYSTRLPKIEKQLAELEEEQKSTQVNGMIMTDVTDVQHIAAVISRKTKIPVSSLTESERVKLLGLHKALKQAVIGQDSATKVVADVILNSRFALKNPKRPVGVLLFLGPTGVGKTELAKALAIQLFGTDKSLIRFDMSEFMHDNAVNRFIGSPPGYVGYEDGGQLTEAVRRNPYCVILLDEFEKAHAKIADALLQVADEARMTDGQGKTVNFSQATIIMTSNLGAQYLKPQTFDLSRYKTKKEYKKAVAEAKKKVTDDLRKHFRLEFLNRLDAREVFAPLSKDSLRKITKLQVAAFSRNLEATRNTKIVFDDDAVEIILEASYNPTFGARPIARYIEKVIGAQLTKLILTNVLGEHAFISVSKYSSKAKQFTPAEIAEMQKKNKDGENNDVQTNEAGKATGGAELNSVRDAARRTGKNGEQIISHNATAATAQEMMQKDKTKENKEKDNKQSKEGENEDEDEEEDEEGDEEEEEEEEEEETEQEDKQDKDASQQKVVGKLTLWIYDRDIDGEPIYSKLLGRHNFSAFRAEDF